MNDAKTPYRFAFQFLRWVCPHHLYEEIEGDLIQKFNRDVKNFERRERSEDWCGMRFDFAGRGLF